MTMSVIRTTQSICPVCLAAIDAAYVAQDDLVLMQKTCRTHGTFQTKVWQTPHSFINWRRPKIHTALPYAVKNIDKGCPFDCGLCQNHKQRSCTILLELTHRCNMRCNICFADSTGMETEPAVSKIETWFRIAQKANPAANIQLSGGEPSLRDDLPEIIALGRNHGFGFLQLNTNGLRLALEPDFVGKLAKAGLASVFLQFDGTHDAVYRTLRGRNLLDVKRRAIENCGKVGLGVVLVPTLMPGVNTNNIGNILQFALERTPTVKGVHFQPVSYFGRYPKTPQNHDRFTLAELMQAINTQTTGLFQATDFNPPGCENALCSIHANYIVLSGDRILSLNHLHCCDEAINACEGSRKAVRHTAKQWRGNKFATQTSVARRFMPADPRDVSLDDLLERGQTHNFMVSGMAFQDAWTLDLQRLQECCIHVMSQDGLLVPFCAYNLTNTHGEALYRHA